MSAVITLVCIMALLEALEIRWQKGETFKEIILSNYEIYRLNMFIYFLRHPTLWFTLFLSIELGIYNWLMLSIIGMKFFDIVMKLNLITKVNKSGASYLDNEDYMNISVSKNMKLVGVVLYPIALLVAMVYI
jgi:hypothetical protein